jgi:DNA-nicking Smr family endonuclease
LVDPRPNPLEPLDGSVDDTLDLHGFTVREARAALTDFLERSYRRNPNGLVHIITGKGKGSASGPVLRRSIGQFLRTRQFQRIHTWASDLDGGGYLVRLGRG